MLDSVSRFGFYHSWLSVAHALVEDNREFFTTGRRLKYKLDRQLRIRYVVPTDEAIKEFLLQSGRDDAPSSST
ncbi:MAG: hypothetical protein IBJ11_12705 [Phycisphaerales bacterium]|nr:hypothetical protein [Phycisphaerales bacterium]